MTNSKNCGFLLFIGLLSMCGELEAIGASNFIVGGTDAEGGEFPHQVSIQNSNVHFCGGSIIKECWILTAANCLSTLSSSSVKMVTVVAGITKLSHPSGQRSQVASFKMHDKYSVQNGKHLNNIGVIKLKQCFTFNNKVKAASLSNAYITANISVITSGWGFTDKNAKDRPDNLQKIELQTMSNKECEMKSHETISKNNFCTCTQNNKGTCLGDRGGAVMLQLIPGLSNQVGVISGGSALCASGEPNIHTRIAPYSKWIEDNTK